MFVRCCWSFVRIFSVNKSLHSLVLQGNMLFLCPHFHETPKRAMLNSAVFFAVVSYIIASLHYRRIRKSFLYLIHKERSLVAHKSRRPYNGSIILASLFVEPCDRTVLRRFPSPLFWAEIIFNYLYATFLGTSRVEILFRAYRPNSNKS
jgi:hypothetical protein